MDCLTLETKDLFLKTVTEMDIEEVSRMWNYPNGSISLEDAQNAINYMCGNHRRNKTGEIYHLCFAVRETKVPEKIIGWCGLDGKIAPGETVLFYVIDENYRGRGYATQCAAALLHYAFETAQVDRITGGCDKNNIPSYKVMTKIGMEQNEFTDTGDPLFALDKETYFRVKK